MMKLLVAVVAIATVIVGCQAESCKGRQIPDYSNITRSIEDFNNCLFYTDDFDTDCILESCPELKKLKLCPIRSGQLNDDNVKKIFRALLNCFRSKKPICGKQIDPMDLPSISANLVQALTGLPFSFGSFQCLLGDLEKNGEASNLAKVQTTIKNINARDKSIVINSKLDDLLYVGKMSCTLGIIQSPKVSFQYTVKFDIDNKIGIGDIKSTYVGNPSIKVKYELKDLNIPIVGFLGPLNPVNIISNALGIFWQTTSVVTTIGNFLGLYFSYGFKAAIDTFCKQSDRN